MPSFNFVIFAIVLTHLALRNVTHILISRVTTYHTDAFGDTHFAWVLNQILALELIYGSDY